MAVSSIENYKGFPTLVLKKEEDSEFGAKFGLKKAAVLIHKLDEVQEFVDRGKEEGLKGGAIMTIEDPSLQSPWTLKLWEARLIVDSLNEIEGFIKDGPDLRRQFSEGASS